MSAVVYNLCTVPLDSCTVVTSQILNKSFPLFFSLQQQLVFGNELCILTSQLKDFLFNFINYVVHSFCVGFNFRELFQGICTGKVAKKVSKGSKIEVKSQ